jgi:hypothetical protein
VSETRDLPVPWVRPTEFTLSLLPQDHDDYEAFSIRVRWFGGERWLVSRLGRRWLNADGEWVRQSVDFDEFVAAYSHDRETAIELAKAALPNIRINGHSVADALRAYDPT